MLDDKKDNKLISLGDVCKRLKINDKRTAEKWCNHNDIPIITEGRTKLTYRILVDAKLDSKIVKLLKSKYPKRWEEMYTSYLNDDRKKFVIANFRNLSEINH